MNESSKLLQKLERGERLTLAEARVFTQELYKAIREGRILAGDRPLRIFRVVKEINDETRKMEAVWKGVETRRRNREVENA